MRKRKTTIRSSGRHRSAKIRTGTSRLSILAVAVFALVARGEPATQRPDLSTVKPIATASLQAPAAATAANNMQMPQISYAAQPAAEDGMINYLRSARGEWQLPSEVDRNDPWSRLLLLAPKRPIVIDLAVFIDGKPYRAAREMWIDDVLAPKKSPAAAEAATGEQKLDTSSDKGTSPSQDTSNDPPQVPAEDKAEKKQDAEKNETSDEKKTAEGAAEKATPEVKTVAAQGRQAPAIRERLVRYLESIGPSVSREEIRWLLAEWGSGPPLILLGPGLSWQRAGAAPLLGYLDQDKDGALSQIEIAGMAERLKKADIDANDVVDICAPWSLSMRAQRGAEFVSEVRRTDSRPAAVPYSIGHPLIVSLDGTTNWQALAAELTRIYVKAAMPTEAKAASESASSSIVERLVQSGAPLTGDELRKLVEDQADVSLRVDFGTTDDATKGISILAIGQSLSDIKDAVTASGDVVTLDLGGDYIEISARGGEAGSAEAAGSQIAVGAAIDGDPLLRTVDRDQDGRLTSRERQSLADFVRGLDRNKDGSATSDEIPIPIRLAVTHGPNVHGLLDSARLAARMPAAPTKVAAPDWFVSADLNGDGDLSPNEFIGTPEMFRKYDSDSDGRLSPAEAIAAGGGQ